MSEKQYVGNAKAITTKFGGMLKISFGPNDIEKLNEIAQANNGWVNLNCSKRKEVSDKGMTHTMSIDDWKPDTAQARDGLQDNQNQAPQVNQVDNSIDPFDDSIPF